MSSERVLRNELPNGTRRTEDTRLLSIHDDYVCNLGIE